MGYQLAADLTLVFHLLFIAFVLFGGLLCLHHIRWIWLHLPSMIWGVGVEWMGWICPLTPLENHFRQLASGQGYQEGFVEHYLVPLIYPDKLTVSLQWFLGGLLLTVNIFVYLYLLQKRRKHQGEVDG
ncbi:MAG: DUF2784 domain-containing protein [Desulfuromonadales bacterium]|nr:DUF2784 domain-containing protein [Desulfuromonadales bacterium]